MVPSRLVQRFACAGIRPIGEGGGARSAAAESKSSILAAESVQNSVRFASNFFFFLPPLHLSLLPVLAFP